MVIDILWLLETIPKEATYPISRERPRIESCFFRPWIPSVACFHTPYRPERVPGAATYCCRNVQGLCTCCSWSGRQSQKPKRFKVPTEDVLRMELDLQVKGNHTKLRVLLLQAAGYISLDFPVLFTRIA